MFCPRCSQLQISDNVSFCSRCGFQLNAVKALLGGDGGASLSKTSEVNHAYLSRRKKDLTIGAFLMLPLALHTAWTTEDLSLDREYTSLIVKCLILSALIYAIPLIRDFFRRRRVTKSAPEMPFDFTARFENAVQNSALPDARFSPAAEFVTGEISPAEIFAPPSVTEKTTNLLSRN